MRKPTDRNYLAIEANPETGITTQEKFVRHFYHVVTGIQNPLRVGVCYEWAVPADARLHYAWLAAGAFYQGVDDTNNQWFVEGRLNFFRGGRSVGDFSFADHSELIEASVQSKATRLLLRTRSDGGGSYQPILRYQFDAALSDGAARRFLDLSCFSIPVRCDKIQYEITSFFVSGARTAGVFIVTGARLVSLP